MLLLALELDDEFISELEHIGI
ncbi:hypothetical protein SBDP1_10012 [Syntrophobacter sp. SbD1]|nr:hypothetical protein SBDP1_10012 [Syntrophobacter sp. SbD1]